MVQNLFNKARTDFIVTQFDISTLKEAVAAIPSLEKITIWDERHVNV